MTKMKLTPKQATFRDAVLAGATYADAYRQAYDTSNMSQEAVYVEASRLMDHPKIALSIREQREAVTAAKAWDLDRQIEEAAVNVQLGRDLKQIAASNGALTNIGKLTGLLKESQTPSLPVPITKVTVILDAKGDRELEAQIRAYEARELEAKGRIVPKDDTPALKASYRVLPPTDEAE